MRYYTILFAFSVHTLVSALQLDFHKNAKGSIPAPNEKPFLQSRNDDQDSLLLFRRTPTKSTPSGKDTSGPSNAGLTRSRSQPNLGVSGGGVRTKPEKPAGKARQRPAQGRLSLDSLQGSQASGSTDRTVKYITVIGSRNSSPTMADGSSSPGRIARSGTSNALSSSSHESSPGRGGRIFLHDSIIAQSPRTSQSSLRAPSEVPSREDSFRSQRSSIDGGRSFSAYHSNQGNVPTTPRSSILSSAGIPSPLGSSVTQSSISSTASPSGGTYRDPGFHLLSIHDSPSSISRARHPPMQNVRPILENPPQGLNQVHPESPASRIGSMEGENGSSRGAPSDRGLDMESLNSRLQRLRFAHGG